MNVTVGTGTNGVMHLVMNAVIDAEMSLVMNAVIDAEMS